MTNKAINANDVDIPAINFAQQSSDPDAPSAGRWFLFFKAGGLYARSNAGGVIGPFVTEVGEALTIAEIDANPSGQPTTLQFPNGTLSDQGGGVYRYIPESPGAAGALVRIGEAVASGGATASLSVDTIPNTYRDLLVTAQMRGLQAADYVNLRLTLNDDGSSIYDLVRLTAYSTTQVTAVAYAATYFDLYYVPGANAPSGVASAHEIRLIGYKNTTWHKMIQHRSAFQYGESGGGLQLHEHAGRWRSTSAITKVTAALSAGNIADGSRLCVYGVE